LCVPLSTCVRTIAVSGSSEMLASFNGSSFPVNSLEPVVPNAVFPPVATYWVAGEQINVAWTDYSLLLNCADNGAADVGSPAQFSLEVFSQ